jgi:orc1/cdc6 family replication initiation protein
MDSNTLIKDMDPLRPQYIPKDPTDREQVASELSSFNVSTGQNLHLHGPRGTGKTALAHRYLNDLEDATSCYVSCDRYNTQYKVLKHLCRILTQEGIKTGYHTSDLQRKIRERTGHTPIVLILDEIDFLLLNDGDSLLYFLSRLKTPENLSLILISSNHSNLQDQIEERTYSSLQPQKISFGPYDAETIYQILKRRGEKALKPRSLHREALSYIASTTQNTSLAIHWLKTAAIHAENKITEEAVAETAEEAHQIYSNLLLQPFTEHHHTLLRAIHELSHGNDDNPVTTGAVYNRYQKLVQHLDQDSLSNRRISDYIKHLELLKLIQAEYHYGGQNGKTREISPNRSTNREDISDISQN